MVNRWRDRLGELALERGGLLALAILALYLWLAPSFIADGDNAEFSTLAVTGGAAHPPGYPLYVLYLRLMSWLPAAPGAHTAALATAVIGAVAAFVLHAACRAWGARPWAASAAVAIVSAGPIALRLHTAAEVFALNDLVLACVLLLAAREGPFRGTRRVVALGVIAGLGLSNQHTCALLAPLGLLGVIRGIREAERSAARTIVLGLLGLLAGLSPYVYLFVAPASAVSWGHVDSLAQLVAHFTRADYGGVGAFSPMPGEIDPVANLSAFAYSVMRGWLWLPCVLAIGMLCYGSLKAREGEPVWGWRMLAASALLSGPLLVGRFDIAPSGIGLYICHRFYLQPMLLLAPGCAVAFDKLVGWVQRRGTLPAVRHRLVRELAGVAVFVGAAGLSLPYVMATHSPAVGKGVVNILESLPENAVVLGTADDLHFGALYAQEVLGARRDVDVIAWTMTVLPWYRQRFARRGLVIDPYAPGDEVPSVRVAHQVLATGRPFFVEISLGNILQTFPSYPYGVLFRVLPTGAVRPDLDEIVTLNRELFATFDLSYPRPDADAEYAAEMHRRYARTWDILARALKEAGRTAEAKAASEVMHDLLPRP